MSGLPRTALAMLLLALAWWSPRAEALTTCTASSTSLAFGSTDGAAGKDTTAGVVVTCSTTAISLLSTVRVRMCLNIGTGSTGAGQTTPRRMANGSGDALQFQIYKDAARSQIWGSSRIPSIPSPVTQDLEYTLVVLGGGASTPSITMYARIPAQAGLAAGSYASSFAGTDAIVDYRYAEQLLGTPNYPASCTSGGSGGGTTSFPFSTTAAVPSSCRAYATTDLDFGTVPGIIGGSIDQTATIGMTCTGRTAWHIGLDNGLNASGPTRRMRQGTTANLVAYELYRDSARTQRWGNTVNVDTVDGTGTGNPQTTTVYGQVPAPQAPAAGSYSDTITVTITY